MTSISPNHITNSTLTNSVSFDQSKVTSNLFNKSKKVYLGPESSHIPGTTNIWNAPYEGYHSLIAIDKGYHINDKEGMLENGIRIVQTPISVTNAALQLVMNVVKGGVFLKKIPASIVASVAPLAGPVAIAGLILCGLEGFLEVLGISRSALFYKENYPSEIQSLIKAISISDPQQRKQKVRSSLQQFLKSDLSNPIKAEIETLLQNFEDPHGLLEQLKEKIYLSRLQNFQTKHFEVNPEKIKKIDKHVSALTNLCTEEKLRRKTRMIQENLEKKKTCLIRRMQHRMSNELEQKIPGIIQDLQSPDLGKRVEAKKEATHLFDQLRTQFRKNILVHTIGIIAVILTIAGLILTLAGFPYLIPCVLIIAGTVFAIGRYYLSRGLLESPDWKFDKKRCLPKCIKNRIYKKPLKKNHIHATHTFPPLLLQLDNSPRKPKRLDSFNYTIILPSQS